MSLSAISPGSLLESPLAATLTTSANQAVSTRARLHTALAVNGNTSYAALDPLTQDLVTLLKALSYGDIAGAKTDLAKYKADLKAQTTAVASDGGAKDAASRYKALNSGSTANTQAVAGSDTLVARISASLSSGSVQGALNDLAGYLVQNGQVSGGLINIVG